MDVSRQAFVRSNPLLEGLPATALDALLARSTDLRVPRRKPIWQPGQAADAVFWVRSGVVKISVAPEDGRAMTLALHGKGSLIGEVAVLSRGPRETLAEAYEEVALQVTPAPVFEACLQRHPALGLALCRRMADRQRRLESRLGTLGTRSCQARLVALLLELAADFGVRDSRGIIVNLKLPHREIAHLIGATRETVSLSLLALRNAGLVQAESKRVVLLNEDALLALAR